MKEKILQTLANFIVKFLEKEKNSKIFNTILFLGIKLNDYCIDQEIYLE